jgi:hypothetical protein
MIPMALQIFLPCYFAEILKVSSYELSNGLFHSNLSANDKSFRSSAVIFMENLKRPIKMQAIGIFAIDIENFINICRFSYSIYAVLESFNV